MNSWNLNFSFLNLAVMKCQSLLEVSIGTKLQIAGMVKIYMYIFFFKKRCDKLSMEVNCGANLSVVGC